MEPRAHLFQFLRFIFVTFPVIFKFVIDCITHCFCFSPSVLSFDMASNDKPSDTLSHGSLSPSLEPKRKVSILTDPPSQENGGYYDNLGFDGPRRKISQVRIMKSIYR